MRFINRNSSRGRIYSTLFLIVIFFAACSNDEEKLELFSAEAFAYSINPGWELNATCRVKGFVQNESGEIYSVKLSYTVDLKTPEGKLLEGIGDGLIDEKSKEKFADLPIETQAELDSAYLPGKYKIIFNVTDDFSQKKISIEKEFELSE
ncbi:MAG: hypothetical protein HYS25_14660 [Ignavibacteriales bacterium]|nr:hypothetical protein [Ignavibacteriales bacterium]